MMFNVYIRAYSRKGYRVTSAQVTSRSRGHLLLPQLNTKQHYNPTLLCGQVVSIGCRNHPVSHQKYLTHQISPGDIYVKSGK